MLYLDEIRLADYIKKECIVCVDSKSRDEFIAKLVDLLVEAGKVKDKDLFFDLIIKREDKISTGVGMGIAIPHAKLDGLSDFFIAVGIHEDSGVDWDSIDGINVKIVFLIGGPKDKQKEYLILLSQLTKILKNESILTKLKKIKKIEDVEIIFNNC